MTPEGRAVFVRMLAEIALIWALEDLEVERDEVEQKRRRAHYESHIGSKAT